MPLERRYASWKTLQKRPVPAVIVGALMSTPVWGISLLSSYLRHLAPPGFFDLFDIVGGLISHFLIFGGIFAANWLTGTVALRRARRLFDNPSDQFAVSVRVKREATYGYDEGLLSFADGWLVFSGRTCSFSIKPEDATTLVTSRQVSHFRFEGPAGVYQVNLSSQDGKRLAGALKRWKWGSSSEGESIFPPVQPDWSSDLVSKFWILLGGLMATAGVALPVFGGNSRGGFAIILGLFALLILNLGFQTRRSLGRIERLEPSRHNWLATLAGIDNSAKALPSSTASQLGEPLEERREDSETVSVR